MLELGLLADDAALAIGLDLTTERRLRPGHELVASHSPASIRMSMFSEYAPAYGFLSTAATATRRRGLLEVAAALADDLLPERDPLADFDGQRGTSGLSDPRP